MRNEEKTSHFGTVSDLEISRGTILRIFCVIILQKWTRGDRSQCWPGLRSL